MRKQKTSMDFIIPVKTYSGIQDYYLPEEKIGPLEADCIKHYDTTIADLIYLFLDEENTAKGIATQEQLFEQERARNYADNMPIYGYTATLEHGAQLTTAQIKNTFHFIWKSYLFLEATDMNIEMMAFFRQIEKTVDPDELLFWSFRFCAWGEYDNPLPYTLYLYIINGKWKRFSGQYPKWKTAFLCEEL